MSRGVAADAASPLWLRENNLADEQKMSAFLLASLPMTLLLAAFIGSVGFAADMTAGERERRSLESLLITPAHRLAIYGGKWLTAFCLTLCVLSVQLILLAIALRFLPFNQLGLRVDVDFLDVLSVFWSLIPVAILAVALQLSVATFAKSFKDAQTLMGLLVFLPMVPIMYTLFNPGAFYEWWLWVPVLGQTVVIKDIFLGGVPADYTFWKFWVSVLPLTLMAFALGVKQLQRPKTIYG
jgi:sodium transport system permease protein